MPQNNQNHPNIKHALLHRLECVCRCRCRCSSGGLVVQMSQCVRWHCRTPACSCSLLLCSRSATPSPKSNTTSGLGFSELSTVDPWRSLPRSPCHKQCLQRALLSRGLHCEQARHWRLASSRVLPHSSPQEGGLLDMGLPTGGQWGAAPRWTPLPVARDGGPEGGEGGAGLGAKAERLEEASGGAAPRRCLKLSGLLC